jgi:hypothetical protein
MADGMADFLNNAAGALSNFINGKNANEAAQRSEQRLAEERLYAQGAQLRQAELGAQTSQTTVKYAALGIALLLAIVILARNKTL